MHSEFWEQFEALEEAVRREVYLNQAGVKAKPELATHFSRYSDVCRREAVDQLGREAADAYLSRDRTAGRRALAEAVALHLASKLVPLDEELHAHEARARITAGAREIAYRTAEAMLVREERASARHELASRCERAVEEVTDLRGERIERLHEESRSLCSALGAEGEAPTVLWGRLWEFEPLELASRATALLAATERPYADALEVALRDRLAMKLAEARPEDLVHLFSSPASDARFPSHRLKVVYRDTLAGLGVRTGAQANLHLDLEERPAKTPNAVCAAVRVPSEVRLGVRLLGGWEDFRALLRVAGEAQRLAFISPELRPELRWGGDPSVAACFGSLFESLARQQDWLGDHFGVQRSEGALVRHLELGRCFRVRRLAALAIYEEEVHSGRRALASAIERYDELVTESTRAAARRGRYLADLGWRLEAACELRGTALEAQVRDSFMTRFGTRWWQNRAAGALLKEIWATGGQYSAIELAGELGLGELTFDALEEELVEGLAR